MYEAVWWDEVAKLKPIPLPAAPRIIDPPLIELIVRCQVQEYMLFCEVLEAFKGCEILIPMPPHIEEHFSITPWDIEVFAGTALNTCSRAPAQKIP